MMLLYFVSFSNPYRDLNSGAWRRRSMDHAGAMPFPAGASPGNDHHPSLEDMAWGAAMWRPSLCRPWGYPRSKELP